MDDLLPDLCDAYPHQAHWLPIQWRHMGGKKCFWGEVVTVRCYHDNSYVKRWVNRPGEGRVLFIDGAASLRFALLGDQLAEAAVRNGWAGIVVYGAIRDAAVIGKLPLGVSALGVCPVKTEKRDKGSEQVSLRICDQVINPGDFVYADLNGVVVSKANLMQSP
uniref:putative 4-hydroxy-4-methyl-2-oxoglutarate aldolase n=1 Tax=Thaumasiovibrio occultus TaxID=1891184 RepID=UPI000B3532DE|nr:putative 4-hydroxy-4-methyl-2-oxoglutarate aldolase [Thaumasiovibrio occultus]